MPITFVAAETGGGKGIFSVIEIEKYLQQNRRVATNMDLYLEHFDDQLAANTVTRLPDKPTRQHMLDLGFGSPPDDKNKHHYGLIVLDEISLFLDTKRSTEFVGLYNWFKQRRKFHWDIIFICQHPDQIQDEFYKALCNQLVMCQERDLIPIPYFAPLLRGLGMSGNMSDGHFYTRYMGKSTMDRIIETRPYENKPHRLKYDTDQFFDDGLELIGEHLVDMRASYSYIPKHYLVERNYLGLKQEKEEMPKPDYMLGTQLKFKSIGIIGLMLLCVYMVFKPSSKPDAKPVLQQATVPQPTQQRHTNNQEEEFDFVAYLFQNFQPHLTSSIKVTPKDHRGNIDFYDPANEWIHQTLTIQDFKLLGYRVIETQNGLLISKGNQKYIVSRRPTQLERNLHRVVTTNDND